MTGDGRDTLRELAATVPVTEYLAPREWLQALYRGMKSREDSYSYLKLAEDLGFSATNVIRLVIAGKRPLTSKAATRIAKAVDLHGAPLRYWSTLVRYANARKPEDRDRLFRLLMSLKTRAAPAALSPLEAEYFGEWYHPVIREMVGLADFDGDPTWIKKRLGFPLRLEEIKRGLELLEALGVIRRDAKTGRWSRSGVVDTAQDVDSLALTRFHQQMIAIARESVTQVDEELRDIQAVTVSLPRAAVPLLKSKIQEWIAETLALEADQATGEVYQLNIQLFPFTRR